MNNQLFIESIDILKRIRLDIHNTVDTRVINQLDKVIEDLESKDFNEENINSTHILEILAKIIGKFPKFAELVESIIRKFSD